MKKVEPETGTPNEETKQEEGEAIDLFIIPLADLESGYQQLIPREFSAKLDLILTDLREFVSFKLKSFPGKEEYDPEAAWSEIPQFPKLIRCWLENSCSNDTSQNKHSFELIEGFNDKLIRDEVRIVPRKRKMIKACL